MEIDCLAHDRWACRYVFPGCLEGGGLRLRNRCAKSDLLRWASGMGVVLQDPRSQFFFMGLVGDEIAFSSENLGVDPDETISRINRAAAWCGIDALLGERLSELSSGQKQRVALAAAIACNPKGADFG